MAEGINGYDFCIRDFIKEFDNIHPYLQQIIFNIAIELIDHCSKDTYQYDERNEWAHKLAAQIIETGVIPPKEVF